MHRVLPPCGRQNPVAASFGDRAMRRLSRSAVLGSAPAQGATRRRQCQRTPCVGGHLASADTWRAGCPRPCAATALGPPINARPTPLALQPTCHFDQLVKARTPALVEAHLLVSPTIPLVAMQHHNGVVGLPSSLLERQNRCERDARAICGLLALPNGTRRRPVTRLQCVRHNHLFILTELDA